MPRSFLHPTLSLAPSVLISFENVTQRYGRTHLVLSDLSFSVQRAEFVLLTGKSGAGKSTVLRLAARLEMPSSGRIRIGSTELSTLRRAALPVFRRSIGFVPQDLKLLNDRHVLANVMLPAHAAGLSAAECTQRARTALQRVGLDVAKVSALLPQQLSGGEQQRVALARALVNRPALLLIDEPAAHLDTEAAQTLFQLLEHFAAAGVSVLATSHDENRALPAHVRRLPLPGATSTSST